MTSALLDDLKARGLIFQIAGEGDLPDWLEGGSRTLYCGFDPTADDSAGEDPDNDGDTSDSIAAQTLVLFQSDNGGPGGTESARGTPMDPGVIDGGPVT